MYEDIVNNMNIYDFCKNSEFYDEVEICMYVIEILANKYIKKYGN